MKLGEVITTVTRAPEIAGEIVPPKVTGLPSVVFARVGKRAIVVPCFATVISSEEDAAL